VSAGLASLQEALGFEPDGPARGNLTLGRGRVDAREVRCAWIENRVASGALGGVECAALGGLLDELARSRAPLVLFIDSAGAKVSEGLPALGAFRRLFASLLAADRAGVPIVAVLGANCFGGASMIACMAAARLFSPGTRLAMSGPAILATAAGVGVLDEAFAAMTQAAISAPARATAGNANSVWDEKLDVRQWLRAAVTAASLGGHRERERHAALGQRLPRAPVAQPQPLQRRDLEALFAGDYRLNEQDGVVVGEARGESVLGLVSRQPVGAASAWRFAQAAWHLVDAKPARVRVLLDCASHAPRLDDERIVLSEFIVDMSRALAALQAVARVELTVIGEAGGGIYVALAAPAHHVSAIQSAAIRVLPRAAIAAILGGDRDESAEAAQYRAAGVADEEIKLGWTGGPLP
jgi:acetyl-CoA carboxylase alpha subunit